MATSRKVAVAIILSFPSPPPPPSSSSTISTPPTTAPPAGATLPEPTFLLVSSRKKQHLYVFPKGGVESGESSAQAAEREAWEEAGLTIGSAHHLTHLLTLSDPSPHILSPTDDPTSPSFVPSCEYSFELFVLPPASSSFSTPSSDAPNGTFASSSSSSDAPSSSLPPTSSLSSSFTSPVATPPLPPSSSSPPPTAPTTTPSHPSLPPSWPESTERHRLLLPTWRALETAVSWGRREGVMREAVRAAREWVEEDLAAEGGLIGEALKRGPEGWGT